MTRVFAMRAAKPTSPGFSILGRFSPDRPGAMTPQHHLVQTADHSAEPLGLTLARLNDRTVIAISGDLDAASTPVLRERLYAALRDCGVYVTVDLSDVTSCDASGLAMLVGARRRAEATGATLTLARLRPQPTDLLRVTGLHRVFMVGSSATDAQDASPDSRSTAA
ncbi:STAS domain-containing protein [Actinomadura sp. 7K534]|uniref:STAS domain-containing protein n=2 Tax=unclassified Actinomadura TaxID=2626254 RepID=UPI0014052F7D|nr:STAS domain-containing protein [Actinomadura sp. 7K534]